MTLGLIVSTFFSLFTKGLFGTWRKLLCHVWGSATTNTSSTFNCASRWPSNTVILVETKIVIIPPMWIYDFINVNANLSNNGTSRRPLHSDSFRIKCSRFSWCYNITNNFVVASYLFWVNLTICGRFVLDKIIFNWKIRKIITVTFRTIFIFTCMRKKCF